MVTAELDLGARLAVDAGGAAEGVAGVSGGAALDAVALASLSSQEEDGNAREEAGKQAAQESRLVQILGVAVDQAGSAESAAAACNKNEMFQITLKGKIDQTCNAATYRFHSRRGNRRFLASIPETWRLM